MRLAGCVIGVAVTLAISACRSSPTDPTAALPAEVRAFLRAEPSLVVRSSTLVLEKRSLGLTVFRIQYGEPLDCFSGCFYASATGVRAGGRTGWVRVLSDVPTAAVFQVTPDDSTRFTAQVLDELKAADSYAFSDIAFALVCSPNTSESLRAKLRRDSPGMLAPLYCPK